MKFSTKDLDTHYQTEDATVYSVPTDGYYEINEQTIVRILTGNTVEAENPKYVWYKFWLPKTIVVQETRLGFVWNNKKVKFLKAGDIVTGPGRKL